MTKKSYKAIIFLALILIISLAFSLFFSVREGSYVSAAEATNDYALMYKPYKIKNYQSSTVVKNAEGETVAVTNGTFTPLKSGRYSIKTGGVESFIIVLATLPESDYAFDFALGAEYSTGELIELPKALITSTIQSGAEYFIYIEYDGAVIERYRSGEDAVFQPTLSGVYFAVYTYVDYFGYISNSILEFEVTDSPVIAFIPPKSLAFNKVVRLAPVYAYNGAEKLQAELKITSPGGRDIDLSGSSFTVSEVGNYVYTVKAELGGSVIEKIYTVACDLYNRDLFEAVKMAKEPVASVALPDNCRTDGNGVLLEGTAAGATFKYSNILDLNALDPADNIISFLPYSSDTIGHAETLEIILTDIHDPYNKVSMQFKKSPWHNNLTFVTAANNERHYCYNNENGVSVDGSIPMRIGDKYFFGGIMRNYFSMQGVKNVNNLSLYSFTMDYPERKMYIDLSSTGEGRHFTVVDFDNPLWVGGSQYTWNGFTTGEVYLSVEFGLINGASASIIVTEVMGQSLSGEVNFDSVAPALTIDFDSDYLQNMPYGVVGKEYAIPSATAQDAVSGATAVNIALKRDNTDIPFTGGGFIPEAAGNYQIVYTAVDIKGNQTSKTLLFEVKQTSPDMQIDIGSYEPPKPGKYFKIPDFDILYGSGRVQTEIALLYNNTTVKPDLAGKIYIDKVGAIKIQVNAVDYLGNTASKEFTIAISTDEVTLTVPYRPAIAHPGQTLEFLEAGLTDFNGSASAQIVKNIYVNGNLLQGNTYAVKNDDTVLALKYEVIINAVKTVTEEFEIPVAPDLAGHFDTDGIYSVGGKNSDEIRFTFDADGYAELKNPVSHNQLRVSVASPVFNFTSLDIYFTDYNNSDASIFIRLTNYEGNASQVRAQLNGKGDFYLLSGSLAGGTPITFFYDSDKHIFKTAVSEKLIFNIACRADGNIFNGFESGGVKLRFAVNGVSNRSVIRIAGISNESFVTYIMTGRDSVAPMISTKIQREELSVEKGYVYSLGHTKAFDVLQGIFDVKTTIFAPDGTKLVNGEIIKQSRNIILDKYGEYVILYETFEHDFTIKGAKEIYITVKDTEKPKITVSGSIANQAELGSRIILPNATVSDNLTAEPVFRILIYDPNYKNYIVVAGESFRFTVTGEYKIVYYAKDGANNVTRTEFKVEVK